MVFVPLFDVRTFRPKASLMVKTELQKIAFEAYSFPAKLGYGNRRREAENGEMRISSVKLG